MTDSPDRHIDYLSATPARVDILERLTDSAAQPATLVEFAGVSRTTVHRTLNELVEREWVQRVDDGYVATATGVLALETFLEARTRFRTLDRLTQVLSRIDTDIFRSGCDLGGESSAPGSEWLEWLESAEVTVATEANAQRPMEWYADRLEAMEGNRLRGLSPTINRQVMAAHRPIVDETPTELVISEPTFRMVAEEYPTALRQSLAIDDYALYVASEPVSIGLTLYGEAAFVSIYDESGRLFASLETSDERLLNRAESYYCRYRENARRVTEQLIPAEG